VSLFWFISAWFANDEIRLNNRISKLWLLYKKVWIYSVVLFGVTVVCFDYHPTIWNIIKAIFPISGKQYWFISTYFLFYLLVPYFKKLVIQLNDKELIILLILVEGYNVLLGEIVIIDCLVSALFVFVVQRFWNKIQGYRNLTFVILYGTFMFIGAAIDFLAYKWSVFNCERILAIQNLFYLLGALALFCLFAKKDTKFGVWGNLCAHVSANVVSVYLLTVHPTFDKYLYDFISRYMPENLMLFCIYFVVFTVGISFVSIFIDAIINATSNLVKKEIRIYHT
jgi:hypothetical protein